MFKDEKRTNQNTLIAIRGAAPTSSNIMHAPHSVGSLRR